MKKKAKSGVQDTKALKPREGHILPNVDKKDMSLGDLFRKASAMVSKDFMKERDQLNHQVRENL